MSRTGDNLWRIRPATKADCDAILEIQRQSPEAAQWSCADYENYCEPTKSAGGWLWLASCIAAPALDADNRRASPAIQENGVAKMRSSTESLLGFLLAHCAADEFEILNLAVRPEARRRGVASALLREALAWAAANGAAAAHLESRASNQPALQFYAAHSFRVAGLRRDYYANPCEDAILLCAEFSAQQQGSHTLCTEGDAKKSETPRLHIEARRELW